MAIGKAKTRKGRQSSRKPQTADGKLLEGVRLHDKKGMPGPDKRISASHSEHPAMNARRRVFFMLIRLTRLGFVEAVDLQLKEIVISKAVGLPIHRLDSVVHAFHASAREHR